MWLFFKKGFVSIVESPNNDKTLVVRARVREDLEEFLIAADSAGLGISETPERDYRYRAHLSRAVVASAVMRLALDIDYGNFKAAAETASSVRIRQARKDAYGSVWSAMYGFQRRREKCDVDDDSTRGAADWEIPVSDFTGRE